ncbi:protein of unknown function [Paraburkholderia kururiensis]
MNYKLSYISREAIVQPDFAHKGPSWASSVCRSNDLAMPFVRLPWQNAGSSTTTGRIGRMSGRKHPCQPVRIHRDRHPPTPLVHFPGVAMRRHPPPARRAAAFALDGQFVNQGFRSDGMTAETRQFSYLFRFEPSLKFRLTQGGAQGVR